VPDRWLTTLRDKEVVFTGENEGWEEEDLARLCMDLGAWRVSNDLNKTTSVLVRGFSPHWKHGTYGNKEARVARHQAAGLDVVIIDLSGLLALSEGRPARVLAPNVPAELVQAEAPPDVRAAAAAAVPLTTPYRSGQFEGAVQGTGEVFRDPENVQRGLHAHAGTASAFAAFLESIGYEPLASRAPECRFDLAYVDVAGVFCVCEVKSLTASNEAWQVRHGLGQVLDYAHWLDTSGRYPSPVRTLLVLEREPERADHWLGLCHRHHVELTWAPDFRGLTF
jgi:hypothetical protein